MKVAIPKVKKTKRKTGFLPLPIPLEQSAYKDLQKDNYLTMKLWSIPTKSNSPVYELNVPYYKDRTPEEWLKFLLNLKKLSLVKI